MTQKVWRALVLGGGNPGDPLAVAHGVSTKPLISIHGRPMGHYVLEAVRLSGRVDELAYVGPMTPEMAALVDIPIEDSGDLLSNLERGLAALPKGPILILTADIPLLTPQVLIDVLDGAPAAGLVYPIVRKSTCEKAFPDIKRTYARLKEDCFTGGNLFLVDSRLQDRFLPRLKAVLKYRKQPWQLARLFGIRTLIKLVFGQLTLNELEARVTRILDTPARAFVTPHVAIGTDIDKDSDLDLLSRALEP